MGCGMSTAAGRTESNLVPTEDPDPYKGQQDGPIVKVLIDLYEIDSDHALLESNHTRQKGVLRT